MLRLHSYILWSMLKFFHKMSQHYILCMIYIYIRGEAHIQYSTYSFFSKTYLTKSVRNVEIAFLYIMKHVKILLYKVTTLHFMYDVYIYIYIYKGGGTHTVACTAHLYSTKHTDALIWSSWGVKDHATSSLFSLFFQHKICNFFFKNIFNKKCQKCWDCIPIYYEAC